MTRTPRIEAIVPAHNEAGAIEQVVRGLKPFGIQRLLVVDDASDDGTGDIARRAGAEVLRLEPGQGGGKGQVMQAGLRRRLGHENRLNVAPSGAGLNDSRWKYAPAP